MPHKLRAVTGLDNCWPRLFKHQLQFLAVHVKFSKGVTLNKHDIPFLNIGCITMVTSGGNEEDNEQRDRCNQSAYDQLTLHNVTLKNSNQGFFVVVWHESALICHADSHFARIMPKNRTGVTWFFIFMSHRSFTKIPNQSGMTSMSCYVTIGHNVIALRRHCRLDKQSVKLPLQNMQPIF